MATIGMSRKLRIPLNVTDEGCAFAIVTRYEGRAYLRSMTSGGGYYPATGVLEVIDNENKDTTGNEFGMD